MSDRSNIAWTDASWNPVRGCERVSEGCRNCYAEVLTARHSYVGGWGEGLAEWVTRPRRKEEARWTGRIALIDKALDAPKRWKSARRIFVNSMSDLFHDDVPADFVARVFAVMAECPQHVFQILTKRPARMLKLLKHDMPYEGPQWPLPNVWLGVSAEDQAAADERVPLLLKTPAVVRWVSAEPLLGPIDFTSYLASPFEDLPAIDWIVVGAESGSGHRPMTMDHARSIVHQCAVASIPVFVKQDNGPRPGMKGRFTDSEWSLKEYPA